MSVFSSIKKRALNATKTALRLQEEFSHPVADDTYDEMHRFTMLPTDAVNENPTDMPTDDAQNNDVEIPTDTYSSHDVQHRNESQLQDIHDTPQNSQPQGKNPLARHVAHTMNIASDLLSNAADTVLRVGDGQDEHAFPPQLPYKHEWANGYPTRTYIDETTGLLTATTQGIDPISDDMSIYDLYAERAERMGEDIMYTFRRGNTWVDVTADEFIQEVREVAKGMMQLGLQRGDSVAFMCHTSYEWDVIDAATMACGAVMATIYDTDSAEQIRNIVHNSDARWLIVETNDMRAQASLIEKECPTLQRIVCLQQDGIEEIKAYASSISDEMLDERIDSIKKTDICSIVYTSGSTAAPKGVEMTHEHYCTMAMNLRAYIPDLIFDSKASVLLFLPQAHSFARAINYAVVAGNVRIYIATGIATLITDLQVAKPTVMIGVPRVFEKVYNAASHKAGSGAKGIVFASAVLAAQRYMNEINERGKARSLTAMRRAGFDSVVYAPLRQALGGRAKWIVSGGAPLDPELLAFFRGAKIPIYEGYGLTETTAPCAFTPLGTPYKQGSVGIPFPGFSIRIAQDGEIQVKGTSVFPRYHKNSEATEESFTDDGWYATGDLGRIDHEGFLYITGRKKDLIITAGGKNVSPAPIEEAIRRSPLVSQALVLGDKRPFISALITLDETNTRDWLAKQGLNADMSMEDIAQNGAIRAEIQTTIDEANDGVSRAESVRKFIILPEDFTQDNGLLTASMKVIRPRVLHHYADLLNTQMYQQRQK